MFKNKVKLAKKLAILLTFGTAAVAATQNSAFAMGSTHAKKHHHHHKSAKPAAKKPAVFEIKGFEFNRLNDDECITQTQDAIDKRMKINISLSDVCCHGKFKFAKFLIEKQLADVDESVFETNGHSPLAATIDQLYEATADTAAERLEFIKFLVDNCGALIDGQHCEQSALVFAFRPIAFGKPSKKAIPQVGKVIIEAFKYLMSKGMDINGQNSDKETLRYNLTEIDQKFRSPYYNIIEQMVVKHGGRFCV